VVEGEILAYVLPPSKTAELRATIYKAVKIGQHRTLEEDADFAFAQISEIAIRALGSAVNDTYTGLSSIDWLGDSLRLFATLPPLNGAWMTKQGKLRLLVPPLSFTHVARTAFEFIRHAAADNPAVCLRLLQTCARLAPQLHNDEQRQAILDQVEAVHEAVARFRHVSLDTDAIEWPTVRHAINSSVFEISNEDWNARDRGRGNRQEGASRSCDQPVQVRLRYGHSGLMPNQRVPTKG
jgi:uncharacterized membrane protein